MSEPDSIPLPPDVPAPRTPREGSPRSTAPRRSEDATREMADRFASGRTPYDYGGKQAAPASPPSVGKSAPAPSGGPSAGTATPGGGGGMWLTFAVLMGIAVIALGVYGLSRLSAMSGQVVELNNTISRLAGSVESQRREVERVGSVAFRTELRKTIVALEEAARLDHGRYAKEANRLAAEAEALLASFEGEAPAVDEPAGDEGEQSEVTEPSSEAVMPAVAEPAGKKRKKEKKNPKAEVAPAAEADAVPVAEPVAPAAGEGAPDAASPTGGEARQEAP